MSRYSKNIDEYLKRLERVFLNWHKMSDWVKEWTRDLLIDDLKNLRKKV